VGLSYRVRRFCGAIVAIREQQNLYVPNRMPGLLSIAVPTSTKDLRLGLDKFRHYINNVTTVAKLHKSHETTVRFSSYKIGVAGDNRNPDTLHKNNTDDGKTHASSVKHHLKIGEGKVTPVIDTSNSIMPGVAQRVKVGIVSFNDFNSMARKYVGFSGDFGQMDLSGVICRLGMFIALYTTTGEGRICDLTNGEEIRVSAIGFGTEPVTNGSGNVWLPRCTDDPTSPHTVFALAAAITGAGGTLVTDMLAVSTDNRPILPVIDGDGLVQGCYHALRLIGSNYHQQDAGGVFAYALMVGIHSILTVVGHTDEGGYMRQVLRQMKFDTPYGGIRSDLRTWEGLPRPSRNHLNGWTCLIDNIALVTAACSSVSDPCVAIEDRVYPTVITSIATPDGRAGLNSTGTSTDALNIGAQLAGISNRYTNNMLLGLCKIFDFSTANIDIAVRHYDASFSCAAMRADRHLYYPSVAPYYWIEPTGILNDLFEETTASRSGFGPLCKIGENKEYRMVERGKVLETEPHTSVVQFQHRSMRTSHFITHLTNSREDGVANYRLIGCDAEQWVAVGGDGTAIHDRMLAQASLDQYMWERTDVALRAPGEGLYIGKGTRWLVQNNVMDPTSWRGQATHSFEDEELVDGTVSYGVTRLTSIGIHGIGPSKETKRYATSAGRILCGARLSAMGMMPTSLGIVSFKDVDTEVGDVDKMTVDIPNIVRGEIDKAGIRTTGGDEKKEGISGGVQRISAQIHAVPQGGPRVGQNMGVSNTVVGQSSAAQPPPGVSAAEPL